MGWCERAAASAKARCGCFVPARARRRRAAVRDARVVAPAHRAPGPAVRSTARGAARVTGRASAAATPATGASTAARRATAIGRCSRRRRRRAAGAARREAAGAARVRAADAAVPALRSRLLAELDELLTERLLKSAAHRAASADEVTTSGAPGRRSSSTATASRAAVARARAVAGGVEPYGGAALVLALLTERASMDSFQPSYTEDDREDTGARVGAARPRPRRPPPALRRAARRRRPRRRRRRWRRRPPPTCRAAGRRSAAAPRPLWRRRLPGRADRLPAARRLCGGVADARVARRPVQRQHAAAVFFARGVVAVPQLQLAMGGGSHADQQAATR